MMGWVKCPKCEKPIAKLGMKSIDSGTYKAVAHCCPYCHTILGAEIDPIAVRSEIVAQVEELLKKHR